MLVLSRHRDESIMIGDNIVLTIVDIRGDKVRLGIDAPRETKIYREEVFLKIKEENKFAASSQQFDLGKVSKLMKDKLKK